MASSLVIGRKKSIEFPLLCVVSTFVPQIVKIIWVQVVYIYILQFASESDCFIEIAILFCNTVALKEPIDLSDWVMSLEFVTKLLVVLRFLPPGGAPSYEERFSSARQNYDSIAILVTGEPYPSLW